MKYRGFNPAQLVARGVFDSLEELDRVMCELDEARREPRVIACAWCEGMRFGVEISDAVERVPTRFPAACAVGAGRPGISPSGVAAARVAEAGSGVANTSQRSPELLSEPASVLCPWCAIERAMNGQGPAPRTGFVSVVRCQRHTSDPQAPSLAAPNPHKPAGARDAFILAPASALPLPRSVDAGPFHPVTNPNAGVVPAFPKGRWS